MRVSRRGALVDVAVVGHPEAGHCILEADWLARQLGVNADELVGRRYTCRVVPDRYGITFSDFRFVASRTDTAG
jgi:hypothetical protein